MSRKRIINSGPSQILPCKSLRASLEEVADCTSYGTEDSGLFIVPVPSDAITLDFRKPTDRNDSSSPNPTMTMVGLGIRPPLMGNSCIM